MKKVFSVGMSLIFLVGLLGTALAWEENPDGSAKTTKQKWIEQKKKKIDEEAKAKKSKVVAPGMKAIDQAGADRKIKEIDEEAKRKKAEVNEDAKKLGGDHIYQKDKPKTKKRN